MNLDPVPVQEPPPLPVFPPHSHPVPSESLESSAVGKLIQLEVMPLAPGWHSVTESDSRKSV